MKRFIKHNKIASSVVAVCLVVAGTSAWGWWHYVYSNPKRVFNRMLATSLSTPSVIKTTTQAAGGQSKEITSLRVNPTPILNSVTTSQGTKRELIATPVASYVRFVDIDLKELGLSNSSQDLSGVLNVWGKSAAADAAMMGVASYNQSLFGIVPVGRLSTADRTALLAQIQRDGVYTIDYSTVKRDTVAGRPTYTYSVSIKPRAFISMVKSFAADLGVHDFEQYDPSTYPESPAIIVTMHVDVWSSQLTAINYGEGQADEAYSGHGVTAPIAEPTKYISATELQTKLQQIH